MATVPDQHATDTALVDAMSKIRNPGKLMKRIADRHEKLAQLTADPGDARPELKRPTEKELLASVTLVKIAMKEDAAEAAVTVAASAKDVLGATSEKVQFRRIKNRWYCRANGDRDICSDKLGGLDTLVF